MSARSATDLKPLPAWQQWWRRTRHSRVSAYGNLKNAGSKALTLAISVLGGTLISYGVWSLHHATGYVVAGLLVWGLQWNHGGSDE